MDPHAISEQIDRILRSRGFASKNQLRKLLQVLHQNLLHENLLHENKDSSAGMTSDQVIRELWPTEIRTKRSADVATEMNRLRHALKSYYDGEGASDPITIILPKRAAGAIEGSRGQPWMVATPRAGTEDGTAEEHPRANPGGGLGLKRIIAIAAVCAALVIGAYFSIRILAVHDEPKAGQLDGSTLVIMNAEGKELWRKSFPEGFTTDWYFGKGIETHIWFGDLEGKGQTSVLFLYSPANPHSHSSMLICYSDRGQEKWRWTPGRELPELNGSPATFRTAALGVLKATDKRASRIVVASIHDTWWPSQIALLDATGKTTSEYWHSGALTYMILADLDGDGKEEIVATGVSEYDHQATLVVLDPDRVFGASTEVRPEFQIHGMGIAQERLRLLFPRSDLNRALFQFNWATEPTVERGSVRLTVTECITPPGCRIWYEFDKNFRLIAAYAGGDEFRKAHAEFYRIGKDAHDLSAEEQAAFQKVRCLVGCKSAFVEVGNLVP
jgi:hypothetical protein